MMPPEPDSQKISGPIQDAVLKEIRKKEAGLP